MDITSTCGIRPAIPVKPRAVTVNGTTITREAIAAELQNHPAAAPGEAWTAAARALAIRELLLQRARVLNLEARPIADGEGRRETDEEALVRAVIARDVTLPEPDDEACQRFYKQNAKRFRTPDLFAVAHILLAASLDQIEARAQARTLADGIIQQLAAAPEAFADLARVHSACPSREVGGALGQIGPGQTVPEFEQALAGAPVGCVMPDAVETRYGFHVVRVDRRDEGRQLPYEAVRERIADFLADRVRHTAVRQYIGVLAGEADIAGVDLGATTGPLIQ